MQLANLHGRAKVTPSSKSWAAMFECLMYHNVSKSFVSNSCRREKTIHCSLVEAYNSNAKGLQSAHQLEPSYTFHVITLTARVARLKWLVPMHQAVPSTTGSSRRNNSVLQTFVQYFLQVLSMQTSAPQKLFFSDISWNPPTKDLRTLPSAEQGTSLIATIQSQKNLQGKALNWTDSIYLL